MILEKETFEKFGYYPKDLFSNSHKKIIVACDSCGKIREIRFNQYRPLCHHCASFRSINKKELECEYCGKIFKVYPCLRTHKHIFCSHECADKWYSENYNGKNNPNWRGGKIKRICKTCGNIFFVNPAKIKDGRGKFCSHSCTRKATKMPTHHTKPELLFEEICKKHNLPFKYTGDGSFWIGNLNPDFIECNGKKIAVEIFGDYWHSPLLRYDIKKERTLIYRKKYYKKRKWASVFLWETDLKRPDAESFILSELNKVSKA